MMTKSHLWKQLLFDFQKAEDVTIGLEFQSENNL